MIIIVIIIQVSFKIQYVRYINVRMYHYVRLLVNYTLTVPTSKIEKVCFRVLGSTTEFLSVLECSAASFVLMA